MICPNFSNPQIRKDFFSLASIVGEDFAYYLWDKNGGFPLSMKVNPKNTSEATNNSLFEELDSKFEGDLTKATLGVALTFSNTFNKKNPGFAKLSADKQVEVINYYLNNLNISLEDAVKNYSRRANTINKTFDRAYADQAEVVTREDLSKDPNSTVNQLEDTTSRDRRAAFEFLKTNQIASKINFINAHNAVNSGAYAQWTKNGLTLFRGSDYTDIYHESWHEFTQWYLTPLEKSMLYDAVRSREGSVTLGDVKIPHYALTHRQAEEILAEEFRAYALQRGRNEEAKNLEPKVKGFFGRMYDFLKWLFFGPTVDTKTPVNSFDFQNVSSMFEALYEGNIQMARRSEENIVEKSLNRSTSLVVPIVTDEGRKEFNLGPSIGAEAISYVSYSIYKQLRDKKIGMSSLLNSELKNTLIPELYTAVRNELKDILDKLDAELTVAEDTGNESVIESLSDQYNNLAALVTEDEAWNRVVELHQSTAQGEIFNIDGDVSNDKDDQQENIVADQAEGDRENEATRNTVEYGDKSTINPLQLYDPYVVELIKSLPDLVLIDGKDVPVLGRNLGLPQNGNFQKNKNLLQNIVSGTASYQEAIDEIILASEIHPQLKYLIQLLPDPNNFRLTAEEIQLQTQFMQALSMPRIDPYSVKAKVVTQDVQVDGTLESKKTIQFNTFFISTLTQDALLEYLDNEFQISAATDFKSETDQSNLVRQRSFVNKAIGELNFATFSTASALDSFQLSETSPTQVLFEFMNAAFGVDLYQGVDPKYLFDKRGSLILNNSRYTKSQSDALRQVILAAYNKVKLYHLINNLPGKVGKKLKDQISKNIETPAKTFIEDVKKPIIQELEALTKQFSLEYSTPQARKKETAPKEVQGTKELPLQAKLQLFEVLDLYHESIKNRNNLRNERQILFRAVENYYDKVVKSASYLNDENNLEWSIREWQHVTTQATELNRISNLSELTGHLNPATNNFIANSRLINRAFNIQTGERGFNRDGENVLFELINISGYTTKAAEGKKTINLTPEDKLVQDLVAFLKDGVFENLRYGAKSTSLGVRTTGSRADRLFYDKSKFSFSEETGMVTLDPRVTTTFRDYLKYELSRMYDDRAESTPKEKRGFDLVILKDILPTKVAAFKDFIKNSTQDKETTVNKAMEMVPYFDLEYALTQYFNQEVNNFKQELAEAINEGRLEAKNKKEKSLQAAFKDTFGVEGPMEVALADYITNYFTQQIEFVHLFVGDPSNFQIKGENWRELFKRLGASISPGKQPIISRQLLDSLNNSEGGQLGRGLERLYKQNPTDPNQALGEAREYDENFTYVQFKDVTSYTQEQHEVYQQELINNYAEWLRSVDKTKQPIEAYRIQAAEIFANTIEGAKNQKKEADGQAYANLDFMRYYLTYISEWGPKQEAAYQHELEIAQKIVEYRNRPTQALLNEINVLKETADAGILVSQKLGYWGSPVDNPNYITLGKYSVSPLIPSVLFGTDMESLMTDMLEKGVDFATFDSGNKMSLPVESIDFYTKEGQGADEYLTVNKIPQENVVTFPIGGLRRQQYIAPKFKESATLSTQLVKLLFSNFYIDGEFSSEVKAVPGLSEKIQDLQQAFINNLEVVVESEKAKIYSAIGATLEGDRIVSIDTQAFADWISKEFDKKDVPQSVYDYLKVNENKFTFSLDVAPHRALFESILASALSKRVVRPKMFGEAMIQVSSLGYNAKNTRFTKPSKAQVQKYGNSGLRDYGRIVNGKHQPAEIKIAFNKKKYGALLNLEWEGQPIETLSRLNQALLDDAWVEEHSAKITLVGVRIPVQGLNSMEHFRIREFLPETAGPIIIVPPSLVTKSGSDFDIDKLFMYEPELTQDGELVQRKTAFIENPKEVYNVIKYKKQLKSELSSLQTTLENKRQKFIETFGTESSESKVYDKLITNNGMIIKPLKNSKKELTEEQESTLLDEIGLQLVSMEKFLDSEKNNPEIKALLSRMSTIRTVLSAYKSFSPKEIKAGASNDLIRTMSAVLSEPAVMAQFLKPNDSPILKGIAEEYNEKYTKKKATITSTSVFSPLTSLKIFRENATGKKALGIDAKTNALHKLYQQVGLNFTNPLSDLYVLKANKNSQGHIILGGLYDANNEYLISDIINEFINGHVDIEKEEWINFFNADKNRTSVILQMVLNGTPIRQAILIANQPIIQHFLKANKLSETAQLLDVQRNNAFSYLMAGLYKLNLGGLIAKDPRTMKPDYLGTVKNILSEDLFTKHLANLSEENYTPSTENSRTAYNDILARSNKDNRSELAAQLLFLTQYDIATKINNEVLDLTSVIDFNTASYRNLNDFHQIRRVLKDARANFNEEAIEKILNNSVLAPFNITSEAISIGERVFDFMGSEVYQDMLNNFVNQNGTFWTADQRVTEVNNFNNAVVHALIQKYSELDGENFYDKFGPKSSFLTKGATGNLYSEYLKLFTRNSEIADASLKKFSRQNLFLRNFRKKDVEGTKKFYVASLTNEKDVVFTNEMQQAFLNGLMYDQSTPEINQRVRDFFNNVANATIVGQGFSIKYRSIHPYLPIQALDSTVRASVELRRINASLLTQEAIEKRLEGDPELVESMISLLSFVSDVEKIYTRNAFSKRVKSLNYWKYFPDYVNATIGKGARISSSAKGIGGSLSLNTAKAKKEGLITKDYPVTFRGKEYVDAAATYDAHKATYTIALGEAEAAKVKLLREILGERFKQHLNLFGNVYDKGGVDFILKSSFAEGEPFMRTNTANVGGYVQALADAYTDVEDRMTSEWLEYQEQKAKNKESKSLEDAEVSEETNEPLSKSPFTEDGGVDFDDLSTMTAPGVNIKLAKKKIVEDDEDGDVGTKPKMSTESLLKLTTGIKIGEEQIDINYLQATPEYLQTLYPELPTERLATVAAYLRSKLKEEFPEADFESLC